MILSAMLTYPGPQPQLCLTLHSRATTLLEEFLNSLEFQQGLLHIAIHYVLCSVDDELAFDLFKGENGWTRS
jgi:hypothetical protein